MPEPTHTEAALGDSMTIEKVAGMLWQALSSASGPVQSDEKRERTSAALSAAWAWMHDHVAPVGEGFLDAIPNFPDQLDEWIAQTQREADGE